MESPTCNKITFDSTIPRCKMLGKLVLLVLFSFVVSDQYDETLHMIPLLDGKIISEFKFVTVTEQGNLSSRFNICRQSL